MSSFGSDSGLDSFKSPLLSFSRPPLPLPSARVLDVHVIVGAHVLLCSSPAPGRAWWHVRRASVVAIHKAGGTEIHKGRDGADG